MDCRINDVCTNNDNPMTELLKLMSEIIRVDENLDKEKFTHNQTVIDRHLEIGLEFAVTYYKTVEKYDNILQQTFRYLTALQKSLIEDTPFNAKEFNDVFAPLKMATLQDSQID